MAWTAAASAWRTVRIARTVGTLRAMRDRPLAHEPRDAKRGSHWILAKVRHCSVTSRQTLNVATGAQEPQPFDTAQPSNSNAGHEYGTSLPGPDRRALLEYLKAL